MYLLEYIVLLRYEYTCQEYAAARKKNAGSKCFTNVFFLHFNVTATKKKELKKMNFESGVGMAPTSYIFFLTFYGAVLKAAEHSVIMSIANYINVQETIFGFCFL